MQRPTFTRRLRLNLSEYRETLARIEARCGPPINADGRDGQRYRYELADIPFSVDHPEGGTSDFLVFGRNISRSGISVLHGGFVHAGSKCLIALERLEGPPLTVTGEVRHCRLFSGSCHEVGVRFDREIDPGVLLGSRSEDDDDEASTAPSETEAASSLAGSALVVESFAADHLLLQHHLGRLGLLVEIAETPGAALDAVKRSTFGVLLFGLSLVGPDGLRTLGGIQRAGFRSPVVLLTAETDQTLLARAREAGATYVMTKPYHIDLLLAQVRVLLGDDPARGPTYSTAHDQPGMPPLIGQYVELVRRTADQVERTYEEGAWSDLRAYCRQLQGSGCAYGFQNVTVAAMALVNALEQDAQSDDARAALRALLECCRSLALNPTFRDAS